MASNFEMLIPVVLSVQSRLQTDMPVRLAELRAQYPAFAESAPDPSRVLDFIPTPSELLDISAGAVIGIGDLPSEVEDDIGSAATGVHSFMVVAFMVHPDQRLLAWGLRLYMSAIIRVFADRFTPGVPGFMAMGVRRTIPGDTLDRQEEPREWLSWAGLEFWLKRDEQ